MDDLIQLQRFKLSIFHNSMYKVVNCPFPSPGAAVRQTRRYQLNVKIPSEDDDGILLPLFWVDSVSCHVIFFLHVMAIL